jgi:hypothetical protein
MKKPTHIQQQQDRAKKAQQAICEALGWPDDNYNDMVYKYGCQFLQQRYCRYPQLVDAAVLSPLFWAYWRSEWAFRDECLLNAVNNLNQLPVERIWWLYQQTHKVKELCAEIRILPKVVQDEFLQLSKCPRHE